MAKGGLTARYRPQTFQEIVGQDTIKTILSRASSQDKPASAYLFSGTRGVGKTTTARIMAKAINCLNGPDFEPCNECLHCSQITKGVFPDVLELDAASHTGVDNVRKLREDVNYMPMMGRYKVIIIDEAHMLSTAAFNALLKTLEEPPRHCVFIMATTAPEKFPATVISRCQHFVFRMVGLDDLINHLRSVLDREKVEYDPRAVKLIAVRGSGSVRDSMSILGQVMAIGGKRIEPENVREVLGLAGHEVYTTFFDAILSRDLPAIHSGISNILGQGLDISFFLREFASCWRNLFLLSQSGREAGMILDLPPGELEYWLDMAGRIPAPLIHAGWQMVVEERKNILKSNEPSQDLELLFFNLAYLPDLLPVEEFRTGPACNHVPVRDYAQTGKAGSEKGDAHGCSSTPFPDETDSRMKTVSSENNDRDIKGFLRFVRSRPGFPEHLIRMLDSCQLQLMDKVLSIACRQDFIFDNIRKNGREALISDLAVQYFGPEVKVEFVNHDSDNNSDLKDRALNHPVVKKIINDFEAKIVEIKKTE